MPAAAPRRKERRSSARGVRQVADTARSFPVPSSLQPHCHGIVAPLSLGCGSRAWKDGLQLVAPILQEQGKPQGRCRHGTLGHPRPTHDRLAPHDRPAALPPHGRLTTVSPHMAVSPPSTSAACDALGMPAMMSWS